jgi:hypothetical protein
MNKITAFRQEALDKIKTVPSSPRKHMTFWQRLINGILTV